MPCFTKCLSDTYVVVPAKQIVCSFDLQVEEIVVEDQSLHFQPGVTMTEYDRRTLDDLLRTSQASPGTTCFCASLCQCEHYYATQFIVMIDQVQLVETLRD